MLEGLTDQNDQLDALIASYESHIEHLYADWRHKPIVDAVMGPRGFQTIAAMMIISEVGDFVRLTHPKQLMSYLGLKAGEYASGVNLNTQALLSFGSEFTD
jgi:transposase